uniref:Uncharacterized protein n=1 Tax=Schistocephalus solidus TaxID=70667 RepID=A0A0V0J499_SCHSO
MTCPLCGCRECRYLSACVGLPLVKRWAGLPSLLRLGAFCLTVMGCGAGHVTVDRCLIFPPWASAAGSVRLLSPVLLALSELAGAFYGAPGRWGVTLWLG